MNPEQYIYYVLIACLSGLFGCLAPTMAFFVLLVHHDRAMVKMAKIEVENERLRGQLSVELLTEIDKKKRP